MRKVLNPDPINQLDCGAMTLPKDSKGQRMNIPPLTFDYRGALSPNHGITHADLDQYHSKLEAAREEILKQDLPLFDSGGDVPADKSPLDAGFIEMPERLLDAYTKDGAASELGRILDSAKRIRACSDRVVVLGIGGSYMGAKALMESCCQPYFNLWSRGARGGRPRMFFEGNNIDNDATQGLLQLLASEDDPEYAWSIVVISKSGGTIETAVAFRQFLQALTAKFGADRAAELVIPVTGKVGKLSSLADELGCKDRFEVPDGVGGRFSVFSPVGLLPAAILGIDIIALLNGAMAMNEAFRQKGFDENVVFQYVAVNQLMEALRNVSVRTMSVWSKSLESFGLWYDQLFAESVGKKELGSTPLTVVNTRDLHSRAQQHQEGKRDKLINNIIVEQWRQDPLPVGKIGSDLDQLDELSEKTLPELMTAAIQGTNQAYQEDFRATTDLTLPKCDEYSMGQLMQMMMLATVMEGRLMGVNPYGQPGVENYKINMNRILRQD